MVEYQSYGELEESDLELIEAAKEATMRSYSPYSKFQVGAAIRLKNGTIFTGNNQENAAYPSGLCAERVAMFYANSKFPNEPVEAIAVVARKDEKYLPEPIPPCGSCRQVLLETENRFKTPIRLIMASEQKVFVTNNIHNLLPINFDESFLFDAPKKNK